MQKRFNAVKELARRNAQKMVAAGFGLVGVAQVHAASVIDTATKTAITAGFTDLKDTVLDVLAVAFPYMIGVSVIIMSPAIVKRFIKQGAK
jgi:hypothetical protein